jgi:hypothetical protein
MLKFGIYTTFYNCERFVDRIFSSIEGLNYENFEWHITDDFSSDRTKEMILDRLDSSSIKDKIKYFDQTEKKQMYWKPNLFFDSTFDWIILVDADDDFDKNFLNVYNSFLEKEDDISLVSSDFMKIQENDNSLHSISYIINEDQISKKISRYHPSCDYLNNLSYSCFGHLRGFKHIIPSFDVGDMLACAEDSYHIFWSNSYGKYLNIPRPLYKWFLRDDSESHSKIVPENFNANFDIALNKLNKTDGGVNKTFNDLYLETSTLSSHGVGSLTGKKITLWTRSLSESQRGLLEKLYYDSDLRFNSPEGEIHLICLNYINCETLDKILPELKGREILFYYQNRKYHSTNEEKDRELQSQLNSFLPTISKYVGFSWWTYIRHFIIRTQ